MRTPKWKTDGLSPDANLPFYIKGWRNEKCKPFTPSFLYIIEHKYIKGEPHYICNYCDSITPTQHQFCLECLRNKTYTAPIKIEPTLTQSKVEPIVSQIKVKKKVKQSKYRKCLNCGNLFLRKGNVGFCSEDCRGYKKEPRVPFLKQFLGI